MHSTRPLARKRNLFLAFDAFGTLYQPNIPVPEAYGRAALRYGITCCPQKPEHELTPKDFDPVMQSFRRAFKETSASQPNYGKATGLGAEKWWANVVTNTFSPFLKPSQKVPDSLVSELLARYSTAEGYDIYPDVIPFFRMLKSPGLQQAIHPPWKWDRTVVGIITNSDGRVPSVLESFGLKVGPRRVGSPPGRSAEVKIETDISFVVLSYDVGFEKPDKGIFDAATQMLKETLAESEQTEEECIDDYEKLFVGDSIEKDYYGAKAAGWHSIFIDRQGTQKKRTEGPSRESLANIEIRPKGGDAVRQVQMCMNLEALSSWDPQHS